MQSRLDFFGVVKQGAARSVSRSLATIKRGVARAKEKAPCDTRPLNLLSGVNEGARTLGHQGHNLVLYQLSYIHRKRK